MKNPGTIIFVIATLLVCLTATSAAAATYDLSGTWSYTTSNNWKNGMCPVGTDSAGRLSIVQSNDTFTLSLDSGYICVPGWTCTYAGAVTDASYAGSNSGVVDDEGGSVVNSLAFAASSENAAAGSVNSVYTLDDFSCEWGFDIQMSRSAEEDTNQESDGPAPFDTDSETEASDNEEEDSSPSSSSGCAVWPIEKPPNILTFLLAAILSVLGL